MILVALATSLAACQGPKIQVKPLGARVEPALPFPPPPAIAAQRALPPSLPGGWRLAGGPADYDASTASQALGDETARFRGLRSYASAEYANLAQRVIAAEAFVLGGPEAARGALSVGRPAEAKALAGDDLDEGFVAGLRAEARKGALLVRVRWFEADDPSLADAAVDALHDVVGAGVSAGLDAAPPAP